MNLGLYWEHDWTADGELVSRAARAAWQRRLAAQIEGYVETLQREAVSALSRQIRGSPAKMRFFAFNALSWSRTDVADFYWPDPPRPGLKDLRWANTNAVHVVELMSGDEVPSQILTNNAMRFLRVLARNVPPVGYKVFELRLGQGREFSQAATITDGVLDNDRYRITLSGRGAITSLIDRQRGNRELVRVIEGRAMNDLGPGQGTLQLESAGPVSVTLLSTASEPLQHTTQITLVRGQDRIDIQNQITQNFADVPTWSFGFNLDRPDLWHEEVGAVIRGGLLAHGGHYSPRNARYDWLTLNHFAALTDQRGTGVILSSADCAFMRFGQSTPTVLDTSQPQLSVLVGGQVDGPGLGIPGQGGDTHFTQRFALRGDGRFDTVAAMKFALEHQNPLVTGLVTGGNTLPEKSFSWLTLSNSNVLLWALKPAEEGISQGLIARFWNLSPEPQRFSLSLATGIKNAKQTTHIETDLADAPLVGGILSASASASQFLTFRLFPQKE
jgi:alpha-mannosidase